MSPVVHDRFPTSAPSTPGGRTVPGAVLALAPAPEGAVPEPADDDRVTLDLVAGRLAAGPFGDRVHVAGDAPVDAVPLAALQDQAWVERWVLDLAAHLDPGDVPAAAFRGFNGAATALVAAPVAAAALDRAVPCLDVVRSLATFTAEGGLAGLWPVALPTAGTRWQRDEAAGWWLGDQLRGSAEVFRRVGGGRLARYAAVAGECATSVAEAAAAGPDGGGRGGPGGPEGGQVVRVAVRDLARAMSGAARLPRYRRAAVPGGRSPGGTAVRDDVLTPAHRRGRTSPGHPGGAAW